MNINDVDEAISDARRTIKQADEITFRLASMIKGRLRNINNYWDAEVLCDLKRELKNFNMTTRTWRA